MPKAYREQFGQLQDKITPMPVARRQLLRAPFAT